jgi:hypothetical protein
MKKRRVQARTRHRCSGNLNAGLVNRSSVQNPFENRRLQKIAPAPDDETVSDLQRWRLVGSRFAAKRNERVNASVPQTEGRRGIASAIDGRRDHGSPEGLRYIEHEAEAR